jgi:hypothetical protein
MAKLMLGSIHCSWPLWSAERIGPQTGTRKYSHDPSCSAATHRSVTAAALANSFS